MTYTHQKNSSTAHPLDDGKSDSRRYTLKEEWVANQYKGDLEVIRNAVFARHGYSFKDRRMRYFFDQNVNWYIPVSSDVSKELTPLEWKNVELLKRYEKHADKYYEYFGR